MPLQNQPAAKPLILSAKTGDANSVTVSGLGDPQTTMKVFDGVRLIGSVTVQENGAWSFTSSAALKTGVHKFTAIAVDSENHWSVSSEPLAAAIGLLGAQFPVAPTLNAIGLDGVTSDFQPALSGTGYPGETITVYERTTALGTALVDPDGIWSMTPSKSLLTGSHALCVVATNAAGFSGAPSEQVAFVVSRVEAPVVGVASTIAGQDLAPGSVFAQSDVVLHGRGEPGATITLYDGTVAIRSFTVDPAGDWSCTVTGLSDARHDLFATQKNSAGAVSTTSNHFVVTVDTTTPQAPAILHVQENGVTDIVAGHTTSEAHPAVSGTGVAGAVVTLFDGTAAIGSALVAADNTWQVLTSNTLANGVHHLSAMQTNQAGTSGDRSATFDFTVFLPPTIALVAEFDVNHLNTGIVAPDHETASRNLQVEGRSEPGAIVYVYDGSRLIGSAKAIAGGTWAFFAKNWTLGQHDISATQKSPQGVTSGPSAHVDFTVIDGGVQPPTMSNMLVFDTRGQFADLHLLSGASIGYSRILITGTGEAGDVIKLYDAGQLIYSTRVGVYGNWECNVPTLRNGAHDFTTTQTTSKGIESPPSNHFMITVDTTFDASRPAPPVILQALDNVGMSRGPVADNGTTDDTRPVISGTGKAGDLITVFDRMTAIGSVLVGPDNTWSLQPDNALSTATHTLFATDTTPDAVSSYTSVAFTLKVIAPVVGGATRVTTPDGTATAHDAATVISLSEPDSYFTQHTVIGEHEAFIGTSGNETIDLNADPSAYFKAGDAHIQGAKGGADVLHLVGHDQTLDLSSLTGKTSAAKLSGIEVIDLGGHANTLKLSLVDVLNLGERDVFHGDGMQQLMVNGKPGDKIELSGTKIAGLAESEWTQHGTTEIGGLTYDVYDHQAAHAELLVQQGLQVTLQH